MTRASLQVFNSTMGIFDWNADEMVTIGKSTILKL